MSQNVMQKNAHYIQTTWNLVNIPSGIFIEDHACERMHNQHLEMKKLLAPQNDFDLELYLET